MPRVLVRGVGDVGSAVSHRLFEAGHSVVIHDGPRPAATRRGMAFADAVFDSRAALAGVTAVRLDDLDDLESLVAARGLIPVHVGDFAGLLAALEPDVLVDARMRKRARPERQRGLARLVIGLGPNFVAGPDGTVDLAIETAWGEELGRVIERGATRDLAGEPKPIAGVARERYVYAPVAGTFRTARRIGDVVGACQMVARIDDTPLLAPIDGVLRGITRDGVPVAERTKVIEVDPRSPAVVTGIGERPGQIADGVLRAVEAKLGSAAKAPAGS
jgi:xanthine dehydrogenase accessory factor